MRPPKVNCRYGAPMGRHSDTTLFGKVRLSRVEMRGDYDSGGAYWGLGAPLYCAQDDGGNEIYFRATNRDGAKAKLLAQFGDKISFYR